MSNVLPLDDSTNCVIVSSSSIYRWKTQTSPLMKRRVSIFSGKPMLRFCLLNDVKVLSSAACADIVAENAVREAL